MYCFWSSKRTVSNKITWSRFVKTLRKFDFFCFASNFDFFNCNQVVTFGNSSYSDRQLGVILISDTPPVQLIKLPIGSRRGKSPVM